MCKLCETQPVYEFTNKRKLCKICFVRWFEKKFLYTVRKFQLIGREDVVSYENKGDFRSVVLERMLKMFSEKALVKLIKLPSKKKVNLKAIGDTIDFNSNKIIKNIVKGDTSKLKILGPKNKNTIKPLYLFLDYEVLLYATIRKLKFKKSKKVEDKWSSFVNNLEKKHPEIKRAIVNSYLELYN